MYNVHTKELKLIPSEESNPEKRKKSLREVELHLRVVLGVHRTGCWIETFSDSHAGTCKKNICDGV